MQELDAFLNQLNAEYDQNEANAAAQTLILESREILSKPLTETVPSYRDKVCHDLLGLPVNAGLDEVIRFFTENPADLRPGVARKIFEKITGDASRAEFGLSVFKRHFETTMKAPLTEGQLRGSGYESAIIAFAAAKAVAPMSVRNAAELLKKKLKGNLPRAITGIIEGQDKPATTTGCISGKKELKPFVALPLQSRPEQPPALRGNSMANQLAALVNQ